MTATSRCLQLLNGRLDARWVAVVPASARGWLVQLSHAGSDHAALWTRLQFLLHPSSPSRRAMNSRDGYLSKRKETRQNEMQRGERPPFKASAERAGNDVGNLVPGLRSVAGLVASPSDND